MTAYAVAVIRETRFGDEIKEYLRRIDDTLAPFPAGIEYMAVLINRWKAHGPATW